MQRIQDILADKNRGTEWLYQLFGRKLLGYAIHTYHINEDAGWDLVYKTIYKVVDVSANYHFEDEKRLGSFMFKMFINYLKNYIRDEKTRTNHAVFIPLEESRRDFMQTSDRPSQNPRMAALNEELAKLEDWQRILLLMRSQDVSYADIAKYVNKPEDQLKVYYQRLKNRVGEAMKKREQPEPEKKNRTEALNNLNTQLKPM
jgi:RNA polymerase sigma factor (sigma-70 family)